MSGDVPQMSRPGGWMLRLDAGRRDAVLLGAAGVAIVLVLMQLVVGVGWVSAQSMPTATAMLASCVNLLASRAFLLSVGDTLLCTVIAFLICAVLAVPLGLLIGSDRRIESATELTTQILRPIPAIALLPVAILVLGIGGSMKIFLAAYAAFWPLLINTVQGVKNASPTMLRAGRSFAWGSGRILWKIRLPSALPFIGTGARLSASVALVICITAELLGAQSGIGQVVRTYSSAGRVDYVYAGILIAACLGFAVNLVLEGLERRTMRWAPQYRRPAHQERSLDRRATASQHGDAR